MAISRPTPDVISLLVCDQIITVLVTGKQSLIGLFCTIHSFRFPAVHPQLAVFCSLTDGHGKTPLTIRIVDSNEARPPLVEGKGMGHFNDSRAIANLALQFHGRRFPQPCFSASPSARAGRYQSRTFASTRRAQPRRG